MKISFPIHFLIIYRNRVIRRRTQSRELGSGDHSQDVEHGPRHVERRHQHLRSDEHGVRPGGRLWVCGHGGRHQSHQRQRDVPGEEGVRTSRDPQRQRADDVQPEGRGGHHRTVIDSHHGSPVSSALNAYFILLLLTLLCTADIKKMRCYYRV